MGDAILWFLRCLLWSSFNKTRVFVFWSHLVMSLVCGALIPWRKNMPFRYLLGRSNRNNHFPLPENLLFVFWLDLILMVSSLISPKLHLQLQNHFLFPGQSFSEANCSKSYSGICKKKCYWLPLKHLPKTFLIYRIFETDSYSSCKFLFSIRPQWVEEPFIGFDECIESIN